MACVFSGVPLCPKVYISNANTHAMSCLTAMLQYACNCCTSPKVLQYYKTTLNLQLVLLANMQELHFKFRLNQENRSRSWSSDRSRSSKKNNSSMNSRNSRRHMFRRNSSRHSSSRNSSRSSRSRTGSRIWPLQLKTGSDRNPLGVNTLIVMQSKIDDNLVR